MGPVQTFKFDPKVPNTERETTQKNISKYPARGPYSDPD